MGSSRAKSQSLESAKTVGSTGLNERPPLHLLKTLVSRLLTLFVSHEVVQQRFIRPCDHVVGHEFSPTWDAAPEPASIAARTEPTSPLITVVM